MMPKKWSKIPVVKFKYDPEKNNWHDYYKDKGYFMRLIVNLIIL